jgi:curved DNA-binding protein CbpA
LQLSPNADTDTINRVFRLLAARYHPDNAETGDPEIFRKLAEAHSALVDPQRRAAYDACYRSNRRLRWKIFDTAAVTCGTAGEKRKRKGILAAAYAKRIQQPEHPGVALRELEELLDCPREHLEFAIWYLKEQGLLARADNGRIQITAKGVDAAEENDFVPRDATHLLSAPPA